MRAAGKWVSGIASESPGGRARSGLTRFLGRERERAAISAHFGSGARLVTLVGPAGAGKTRLACEVMQGLGRDLEAGVCFCDLSEARSGEAIAAAVARALEVSPSPTGLTRDARGEIGTALRDRGALVLVMDNLEQALSEAAECAVAWLERAPWLRLLATSRERLRLSGEHLVSVGPLSLPARGDPAPEVVARAEAVALFVDRAREVKPDFVVDEATASPVIEIVDRLDGLPLAIELAASRMVVLDVDQLAARLRQGLGWLTDRRRDTQRRHQILSAAVAWSWELLAPWERSALVDLSVLCGGFSLEAAEAVIDLADWPDAPDAIDVVEALWEKSFLVAVGTSGRWGLYGAVREFASNQDDYRARRELALERHARFFSERGLEWSERLEIRGDPDAGDRLETETDNLRAVAETLGEEGGGRFPREAVRACVALATLQANRGLWPSQLLLLGRAATVSAAARLPVVDQVRLATEYGRALWLCGRLDDAEAVLKDALDVLGASGDASWRARLLFRLAQLQRTRGKYQECDVCVELAEDALAGSPRRVEAAFLPGLRAGSFLVRGQLSEAEPALREAIQALEPLHHRRSQALLWATLGNVQRRTGRADEARASAERALECARQARDARAELAALVTLGLFWAERGRQQRAREPLDAGLMLARRHGEHRLRAMTLAALAVLDLNADRRREARALLEQAASAAEHGQEFRDQAYIAGLQGLLEQLDERLDAARAATERALEWVQTRDVAQGAAFGARLAAILAAQAENNAAAERLALGPSVIDDPELAIAVRLDRTLVGLAATPPKVWSHAVVDGARQVISDAHRSGPPNEEYPWGTPDWAQRSFQVRFRLRLLEPQLSTVDRQRALLEAIDPDAAALLVIGDAARVRAPGSDWAVLEGRPTQQRLVSALIEARRAGGAVLDQDALVEAGWPGERMAAESASNRLHYTLNQLRRIGLRDLLERNDAGYFFDPRVPVLHLA